MKTRTLLLLSVAVGLAILLAGGVLLFQLSNQSTAVAAARIGERVEVGDVVVTVLGASETADALRVDVRLGGIADPDGTDSFRLVTGDEPLTPLRAPADGRCTAITVETTECALEFDLTATDASNRVLVLRRGDDQIRWDLGRAG